MSASNRLGCCFSCGNRSLSGHCSSSTLGFSLCDYVFPVRPVDPIAPDQESPDASPSPHSPQRFRSNLVAQEFLGEARRENPHPDRTARLFDRFLETQPHSSFGRVSCLHSGLCAQLLHMTANSRRVESLPCCEGVDTKPICGGAGVRPRMEPNTARKATFR